MKTPLLLDVPKSHPSRKERIEAFKKLHGIETHCAKGETDDEYPKWMAAHLPSARKLGYGCTETSTLIECVLNVARLMDETGIADHGKTEAEAIRRVCANVGIPCPI